MRKSWRERALELLAEQQAERRLPIEEWVKLRLGREDWETLRPEAVRFAKMESKRRRGWNSSEVLPRGYDPESIVAEAVGDLLEEKGLLAPGWTRERLMKALERLIRRKIRLLASLKEGRVTRGGLRLEQPEAESQSAKAAKQVPDGSNNAYEAAVAREERERQERLKGELERFLGDEPELVAVFRCLWAGMTKPAEIAARAGIEEGKVGVLRRRLERRMARFRGSK